MIQTGGAAALPVNGRPSTRPARDTTGEHAARQLRQPSDGETRHCQRCDRDRAVPELMARTGIPTCRECREANRRAYNRAWSRRHHPRRPCNGCGGPKPPGVGLRYCDACRSRWRWRCTSCGTELPSSTRRRCDACKAATRRRKVQANLRWNQAHPDRLAAAQRRYAERYPERVRAATRRWYEQTRSDPEAWARLMETHRLAARLRAERDGRPMRPVPEDRYPAASTKWTMPAEELRVHVRSFLLSGGSERSLAQASGVSERLLYRLLHEDANVSVGAADRIAVALGLHLDLVA